MKLFIFLCHASEDKPKVRRLANALRAAGFYPWLDEEEIQPGQDWELEIRRAVRKSDIVLVCLSSASTKKRGVVQKEIRFALDAADELPEGSTFIIPCRLDECVVPQQLQRWHWVSLFSSGGQGKLISTLHKIADSLGHTTSKVEMSEPEVEVYNKPAASPGRSTVSFMDRNRAAASASRSPLEHTCHSCGATVLSDENDDRAYHCPRCGAFDQWSD